MYHAATMEHRTIAHRSAASAEASAKPGEYIMLDGCTGLFWVMDSDERLAVLELRLLNDERSVYRWTTWFRV